MQNLKPGYYWVRGPLYNIKGKEVMSAWELAEFRYNCAKKELEAWFMGWDIPEPLNNFSEFIKVELPTPDGETR